MASKPLAITITFAFIPWPLLRHSFSTRLLYSLIPASWYAKDFSTIDAFSAGIADDLATLFSNGVTIEVS